MASVLAHIVTYHSSAQVILCIESLLAQEGFESDHELTVELTDNASGDGIAQKVTQRFAQRVGTFQNSANFGFCGAHNQAAHRFLQGKQDYLLILNPDTLLSAGALSALVSGVERHAPKGAGMATPLLLRCDEDLKPVEPELVDAAGMHMTRALRHFDRGSGEIRSKGQFNRAGFVFGGTGACLLLSRACVKDLTLRASEHDEAVWKLYPQLREGRELRAQLFDEAFFAYREDADLAWRAQIGGWGTCFIPESIVYHERKVVPERRAALSSELNRLSVRNRFLLQASNLSLGVLIHTFFMGLLWRNALVVVATLVSERTSIRGLREVLQLLPRALARRRAILKSAKPNQLATVGRWFSGTTFVPFEGSL